MALPRRVSMIAVGALLGALLVPVTGVSMATAAELDPSGLDTGFQIDGDKTGGTPPDTFDWASFLTNPPNADGTFAFTPTGPYTTTEGNESTGILDAYFEWDNGSLGAACGVLDATGSPGSQTPNTIPWAPGSANVNDKGDLCSTASAYEIVVDDAGLRHAVLYTYWTRLVGNGSLSVLQLLEGPLDGRCDDVLVVSDYESNAGTMFVHFREWVPASGDCADPNGAGAWVETGTPIDFDWAVGARTEGPPLGNQPQATFGEFAVDLTTAGLFSPEECTTFTASTMLSRTGSDFEAQTQDYLEPADPLVLSNCGSLTVAKEAVPAGADTDELFDYTVDRVGGGIVLPTTDATSINADIAIGETDTYLDVLGGTDYQLSEIVSGPWQQQSLVCTATEPGTGEVLEFVLDDAADTFTVFPNTVTNCVITNATSTVTVTKQTLPDGSPVDFTFDIGGNAATLSDGESATFAFAPGTAVTISETVPAGWAASAAITCTDAGGQRPPGTSTQVTTVAAQDIACTFTNTQLGTIVINKQLFGDPAEFDFVGDWAGLPDGGGFSIDALTGDGAVYAATFPNVAPGSYSVTEPEGQNGTLLGSLACSTNGAAPVVFEGPTADFDVAPGDTVTCNYVNVSPGQIVVIKQTVPTAYDQDFPFTFGVVDGTATAFELNAGLAAEGLDSRNFTGLDPDVNYVVTEGPDAENWTLTAINCTVNGNVVPTSLPTRSATIDLPAEGVGACVFVNTAAPGQVTVAKTVSGAAADFPWSFDFQISGGGVEPTIHTVTSGQPNAVFDGLVPGVQYTLTELAQSGWTPTLDCGVADADPAVAGFQFVLTPGEGLDCEANNDAAPASVTVEKTVAGVTPGYEWDFGFTLDPADGVIPGATQTLSGTGPGTDSATWSELLVGETYTLTENAAPGWVVGALTCVGLTDLDAALPGFQFEAAPGQVLECSITNTAAPIDLDVTKTALGGDATFQFILTPLNPVGVAVVASAVTVGGTGVATFTGLVAGGTYSLSENDLPGWIEGTLACTLTHVDGSTDEDLTTFTLEPGDLIACAVENQALGRIVIVKNVVGDDGTFDFAGTWLDPAEFSIETSEGTGSQIFVAVPAGDYTVEEIAPVGYDNTELECVDGTPEGGASTNEGLEGLIALDPGETVICTFTNTQWGSIIVDKTTLPAGSSQEFDFEWGPEGTAFTLTDASDPFSTGLIAPGEYSVSETSEIEGWSLTDLTCIGAEGEPVVEGSTVSVQVPLQETVFCEFTNALQAPLLFDKSLIGSPQKQANGSFLVRYAITVENPGGLADVYDLEDHLQYGSGITIVSATIASLNGIAINPAWNGVGNISVATDVPIAAGIVHTFNVDVTVNVPSNLTLDVADCTAASGEGTGLLNTAVLFSEDGEVEDSACAPVPAALPATGMTLGALWLAIGLLAAGAILLLRRRIRTA